VCETFYLHGEYFPSTSTANDFNGFAMYSSKDLATWKNEGLILPQQPGGELGPNRKGERPHIVIGGDQPATRIVELQPRIRERAAHAGGRQ